MKQRKDGQDTTDRQASIVLQLLLLGTLPLLCPQTQEQGAKLNDSKSAEGGFRLEKKHTLSNNNC